MYSKTLASYQSFKIITQSKGYVQRHLMSSLNRSSDQEASNQTKKIIELNFTRNYIEDYVLTEFKNHIDQRNKELRFVPNRLVLPRSLDKPNEKIETIKLFGDYLPSQDTAYWSEISQSTSFNNLCLIEPELQLILYSILRGLDIDLTHAKQLRQTSIMTNFKTIAEISRYVERIYMLSEHIDEDHINTNTS